MTAADSADPPRQAVAAEGWRLEWNAAGRLDLVEAGGTRHEGVDLRRAFPVSRPLGPLQVAAADGRELAWLESLAAAPHPLRTLVEEVLSARERRGVITAIESVGDGRPADWVVATPQGRRRFRVAHAADLVRRADGSICVIDSAGVMHEIPDPTALDAPSRRLLERLL